MKVAESGAGISAKPGRFRLRPGSGALLAGIVLALAAARFLVLTDQVFPSSLTHDELLAVTKYQGRGVLFALTTYDEPNNHILYDALTAALPGWPDARAARSRLVPFASTAVLLAALGLWTWRRGRPLAAAAVVALLVVNTQLIALWISARGYGLLALLAAVVSMAFVEFVESGSARPLAALAAATVLGIWTVPTFVLFAGPLLLLAFAARPGLRAIAASALAAGATLALHAPVLGAMRSALGAVAAGWGRDFSSPTAIAALVRLSLLPLPAAPLPAWTGWLASVSVLAVLLAAWKLDRARARPFLFLAGAVGLFLALCLALESPVFRATVFIAVPIVLVAILPAAGLLEDRLAGRARSAAGLAVAAGLAAACVSALRQPPWEPGERWKEAATTIERTFPPGTAVFPSSGSLEAPEGRWAAFLGVYFRRPGDFPSAARFDASAFASGQVVVHERPYRADRRLSAASFPSGAVRLAIPQEHLGSQAIWIAPPPDGLVSAYSSASGEIRPSLPAGGLDLLPLDPLTIRLREGRRYRSLVLAFDRVFTPPLRKAVLVGADGHARTGEVSSLEGGIAIASLGDSEVRSVTLRGPTGGPAVRLVAAWAYSLP